MNLNLTNQERIELLKITLGFAGIYLLFAVVIVVFGLTLPKLFSTFSDVLSLVRYAFAGVLQFCAGMIAVRKLRPGVTGADEAALFGCVSGALVGFSFWVISMVLSVVLVFVVAASLPTIGPLVGMAGMCGVLVCGVIELGGYVAGGAIAGAIGGASATVIGKKQEVTP